MEANHHHHHHHHHHHGSRTQSNTDSQETESTSKQETTTNVPRAPVLVPKPNEQTLSTGGGGGGVQATSSFHSVSSIDSSAEMAKYFPDVQTPSRSPYEQEEVQTQQVQPTAATTQQVRPTAATTQQVRPTAATAQQAGSYATVPVPTAIQPAQVRVAVPQQQVRRAAAAPALPQGIPGYVSQIEGLSVSQVVVNDVIIDLQSKVINESQQQYYDDSTSGNYLEQLPPIYIRAPNPSIILRSDLQRLRAQLAARPPVVARAPSGFNQFQGPSFPPPQQYIPPGSYGRY